MKNRRPLTMLALGLLAVAFHPTTACAQGASSADASAPSPRSRPGHSPAATPDKSTYLRDIQPIFMGKCARCHNDHVQFLYNWLDYKTAYADRKEIRRRVWDSWKGSYYKQPMPAGNSPECQAITDEERRLIKEWVDSGATLGVPSHEVNPKNKGEKVESGKRLYATICTACHQPTGQGIPSQFPPLAASDFLNSDKNRAIKILLHGRQGEIVVNGQKFNNSMPSLPLSDEEIASALTFVYSSFGNSGKEVTAAEVKALRAEKEEASEPAAIVSAPREASPFE